MSNAQETQGDNPTPTPEELKLEEEALKEANEEEIRSQVIEKYELDEDEQEVLIDTLVTDTLEQRKSFGKVIQQKRKWREAATKEGGEEITPPKTEEDKQPNLDALVTEKFEERDLDGLDFPEDVKPEIQKLAKLQDISVREAAKDNYIQHLKEEYEAKEKIDDASISRKNKGKTVSFDADTVPSPDMSTKEGRKEWKEWKEFKANKG